MKKIIIATYIAILATLLFSSTKSMAAFPIKKVSETNNTNPAIIKHERKATRLLNKIHGLILYPRHSKFTYGYGHGDTGAGTAALVLGITAVVLSLYGGFILGILAIIFGSKGKRLHEKGSQAGIILGIISIGLSVLEALAIIVIAAAFAGAVL